MNKNPNAEIPNACTAKELRYNRKLRREARRNRPAPEAVKMLTDRARPTDGEDCVYCGKDSWTCEHFEASNRDADESLADCETDASRNA